MKLNEQMCKWLVATCLVCLLLLMHSSGYTQPAQTLKLSQYLPPTHPIAQLSAQYCQEIEKRTAGRVKITHYAGGQIGGAPVTYNRVVSGGADIGFSAVHYTRGRFPLSEVLECPIGVADNWIGAKVFTDFYDKFKPKEWDDVHPLLFSCATPVALQMSKKQVRTMKDLQGQVVRTAGRDADVITALGGIPRALEIGELYDQLLRGTVHGVKISVETAKTFRFAELCKYITLCPQISNGSVFYLVMNKGRWNSMPQEIKQIFTEVSQEYSDKFALTYNQADLEGKKFFLGMKGNEWYTLPDSEGTIWRKAVQPVVESYVEEAAAKGFSREQIRGNLDFIAERIQYWTVKFNELKIPSVLRD